MVALEASRDICFRIYRLEPTSSPAFSLARNFNRFIGRENPGSDIERKASISHCNNCVWTFRMSDGKYSSILADLGLNVTRKATSLRKLKPAL